MKHLNGPLYGRSVRYFFCLVLAGFGAATASATITVTNPANIALAATQVGTAGNTEEIADVTSGLAGASIPFTEGGTNPYSCCGGRSGTSYGIHNLNDGDVGIGNPTDGLFAIPDFGPGAVVMDLAGGVQRVCSIAIYHGYDNRSEGNYTLKDGVGNVVGQWSANSFGGTDAYWMTFPNPVITDRLVLDVAAVGGGTHPTPSFREVQVFCGVTEAHFFPDSGQPLFPFGNLNVFKQYAVGFSEAVSVGDTVEIDLLFTTIEFGGSLDASFDAAFGFEFGLCLGGNANYDMKFSPQVILPDLYPSEIPIPMTINPGRTEDSNFTTVFPPLGQMYADLIVHMEADVNAEACVFGCFDPLSFLPFPLTTCDFPALQPSNVKLFNLSSRCDPTITAQKYCAIELASFNRDGQSNIARMLNVGADDRFEFFAEPYKEFALGVSSGKSFIANPGNNTISIAGSNPFPANSPVRVSSTGTLPLGLKKSKIYYTTAGGSQFSLSNSPNGAPVGIMSVGVGSHSLEAPVVDEDPDPLSGKYGSLAIAAPTISTNSADPALRHLQTANSLRGQGAEDVIGVGINVAEMAKDFIFPPLVPPLSDSGSLGPIGWNYTLAALDVGPAVQLQMDYEFTWDLVVTEITFTKPVRLFTAGDAVFNFDGSADVTKLSLTNAPDRAFHLTNCGPNALPLIYLHTDKVPGTGNEAGRMVPKVPQDAVGVSIEYKFVPKLKTVVSLPFVGRISYEVLAAGAEISRVGDFGFGPIVEGEHKFKFGEFVVYDGVPMELDSTGSGLVNFTMRSTGPPSFDWNPSQLPGTTYKWTEQSVTAPLLSNWFEDSGSQLKTGFPGQVGGTSSAAKIVQSVTGPNLSKPITVETLQVGPARALEVKPDPATSTRSVLTVNGLFENAGSVQIRGDSAIQLGSRESVMSGIGSLTLFDGGAIVGSSQENPAVCNYNGIYGSGYAFDQTFSLDESIRSINHNMGQVLAYGGTGTTGGNSVDVSITADDYPGDITWAITTSDGTPIANGAAGAANTTTIVTVPLPDGDYNFTFSDSEGDGGGSYTLYSSIGQPLASGADVLTTEVRPFFIYNGPFLKTGAYTMLNMAEYGSRTGGRMVIDADNMDNQTGSKITAVGVGAETHVRSREVEHGATVEAKAGGKVILYPRSEESLVTWRAGRSFREDCGIFSASDNGVIHAQSSDMYGGCFIVNGTGSVTTNNSQFTSGVFEIGSPGNPTGVLDLQGPSPFSNTWRADTFNRFDQSCLNIYGTLRVSNQGAAEIFDSELFANHGTVQVDFGSRLRIHTVTSDLAGASVDSQIQPGCANMTNNALLGGTWDIAGVLDIDGIGTNGNANFKMIGADIAPARISSATRGESDPSPAVYDPETAAYIAAHPNEQPLQDGLKRPFDTTKILSEGRPAHVIFRGGGANFNALSTVELNCGKISIIDGARFRPLGDFVNKGELVMGRNGGTGSSTFEVRNAGSFTQIGRNASTTILDGGLHRISSASGVPKRFNILGGTFTNSRTTGSFHMFQDRMLADAHVRIESPMDDLNPDPEIYEQAPVTVDIGGTVTTIDAGAEVTIHGATVHFDALKDNLRTIKGKFTLSGDGPINAPEWRIAEGNGEALTLVGGQLNVLGFGTELKTGNYSQTGSAETRVGVGACLDTNAIAVATNGGKFIIEVGSRPDQIPSGCLKVRSNIGANFNGQLVIDFVDELAASNSTIDIGDTWEIIAPGTSAAITGIDSFEARLDGDLLLPGDAWLPPGSQLELIQYATNFGPRGLAVRVTPTAGFFAFNDWTTANGLDYNRAEADPFRFTTASSANNITSFLFGVNGTSKFTVSQGQGLSLIKGEDDDPGMYAQLSYTRPFGTDATYAYYLSRDLVDWRQAPMIFVPGGSPPPPGELEMVTLRTTVPVPEDRLFMRVDATINPDNFQDGEIPGKKINWTGGLRGFSPNGTTYLMEPGKELFFNVSIPNGESSDTVWGGTDPTTGERNFIYQDKSDIQLAALHSGLLLEREQGTIKITLIDTQPTFTGSLQNDGTDSKITSRSGVSEGESYSYRIELISKN